MTNVKQAADGTPRLDEAVVERVKAVNGAWDTIIRLSQLAAIAAPEKRAVVYRREVAPFVARLAEERDVLRDKLDQGADELGDLGDDVPESPRERTWFRWLNEYEVICTVLAVAEEVRIGKAIVWPEARP